MGARKSHGASPSRHCRRRPAKKNPCRCSAPIAASNSRASPRKARKRSAAPTRAERELMEWKTAQFMESHLGEEYDALIISVQKFGFFVELVEIFVEGLVSIDRLEEFTGQRCVYRDRDHAIVCEPHRRSRGASPRRIYQPRRSHSRSRRAHRPACATASNSPLRLISHAKSSHFRARPRIYYFC